MHWLLAISIAFFCWATAAYGTNVHGRHAGSAEVSLTQAEYSPGTEQTSLRHSLLSEKATTPRLSVPPRIHALPSSLTARAFTAPAYVMALEIGTAANLYRQIVILPPRLKQLNWMLRSPAQQSRLGGWKESNILYSGMLIYHL